jgi:hypothetical protein
VHRDQSAYNEDDAFLCACKNEPYTAEEWDTHVSRLRHQLADAESRWREAECDGVCLPERFQ